MLGARPVQVAVPLPGIVRRGAKSANAASLCGLVKCVRPLPTAVRNPAPSNGPLRPRSDSEPTSTARPTGQQRQAGKRTPHHMRTRWSGEQRGITAKASEPDEAPAQPLAQVSSQTDPASSQLPKLMAQASSSRPGRHGSLWSTALAAWLGRWGCSEAHACVVGQRTRRRGWLSSAEVQTGCIKGAGRRASAAELGRT